ncbi:MAG: glycosyl transferase [Anaerolineaceae bacterium]|nr:glycosyl transferase [Anaerolineaceae bacterium]
MSLVSVIIPCYNEEKHITNLLGALKNQTYSIKNIEIIIADGNSTDDTVKKIELFKKNSPNIKIMILQNEKRIIPSALNLAIQASQGDYIIRMDAHSLPNYDYIERCVSHLEDGNAENVGGLWLIQPASDNLISKSIAYAASHPLGVGDAKYRYSEEKAYVETVPYGAFKKDLFNKIGLFDENLLANEDYEFNTRIQKIGGRILFDPKIKTKYIARENLRTLWKQYFNYGFWKFKMLQKYPETIRWRQASPPLFVISIIMGSIIAVFIRIFRIVLFFELLIYFGLLILSSIKIVKKEKDLGLFIGIPLAILTMHFAWGLGFLSSFFGLIIQKK